MTSGFASITAPQWQLCSTHRPLPLRPEAIGRLARQRVVLGFAAEQHRQDAEQSKAGHEGRHPVEAAAEGADQEAGDERAKLVMMRALPVQNPTAVERMWVGNSSGK